MQMFNYKSFGVRLSAVAGEVPRVQVNIYNPANAGHSYCAFVTLAEPASLEDAFALFVSDGLLDTLIPKAQLAFENT